MKPRFNEELLNSLLKFDFLVLDNNVYKKTNRHTLKTLQLHHSSTQNSSAILEPGEAIKSLKQLIRLFNFLSKKKNPMLYVQAKNSFLIKLLYFFANKAEDKISLDNNFAFMNFNKNSAILSLDSLNSSNLYKHFFNKNLYIIAEVNTFLKTNDYGSYKLHNTIDNYKKLILLAILLKKIYLK